MELSTKKADLKEKLIKKLVNEGLFWSYDKFKIVNMCPDSILIEHTLKYGDIEEIKILFKIFKKSYIKSVWEKRMKYDCRFLKLNYYLARIFFNTNFNTSEIIKNSNERRYRFKNITF